MKLSAILILTVLVLPSSASAVADSLPDLDGTHRSAYPALDDVPSKTVLVLNAADPEHPIAAYTPGGSTAQIQLIGATPMAGGFTVTGPTGQRFTNQISNEQGVVDFFEVAWTAPYGNWTVTHKPGLPAFSPELEEGEVVNATFDPASYPEELLLRFNVDARGPPVPAAPQGQEAAGPQNQTTVGFSPLPAPDSNQSANASAPWEDLGIGVADPQSMSGASGTGTGTGGGGSSSGSTTLVGPTGYTFCASEGQYCSVSGTKTVAYGNSGGYKWKWGRTTGVTCSAQEFGDPSPGNPKACWSADYYPPKTPPSSEYSWCADQGQICSFSGTRDAAYGASGYFAYKTGAVGGFTCDVPYFGRDPYPGVVKACYTKGQVNYVPPNNGYTFCAFEGQYCDVTGTKTVAYGNSGSYYYKFARTTGITCSVQNFGDPAYGAPKACWTADSYPPKTAPVGYSWCADQGQTCSFSGARDAAYGANGYFVYKSAASGGFTCDVPYFGQDPYPGVMKYCFTKTPVNYVAPNSGYTLCAYEGQYCDVSGTKTVAYGNTGSYYYKFARTTGITCSYQNFGDPAYGTPKACWTTDSYPAKTPPAGYTWCADQGQTCAFTGTQDAAYGASGAFAYKYATSGSFTCDIPAFGYDPNPYVYKSCYVTGGSSQGGQCPPPNWEMQANNWKWVNTVVTHSPYGGRATVGNGASSTTDIYAFGNGGQSQSVTGASLSAQNGETVGLYQLMGAAYYYASNQPSGCGNQKVVLTEYTSYRDQKTQPLYGADKTTDADDIQDFVAYTGVLGADVKSLTLAHRFQARDNGVTTGATGEYCVDSSSSSGTIYGLDISVSFSVGSPAASVSVGGQLKYTTTLASAVSYHYCFGNSHSYDWDNLGGSSDSLGKAFRLNW